MKQFNAKTKFNCTLIIIKYRVPRKNEKRFHIERQRPTGSTSGTGTCSTREKGSIITTRSEQTNVACKRFPRCSHIPCTKRYVLKIPGCKVMKEWKWCEHSLCYCTVRQQVLSTQGDDSDVLAKLHSTLHTQYTWLSFKAWIQQRELPILLIRRLNRNDMFELNSIDLKRVNTTSE